METKTDFWTDLDHLATSLAWLSDMGISEIVEDQPLDRLTAPLPKVAPAQSTASLPTGGQTAQQMHAAQPSVGVGANVGVGGQANLASDSRDQTAQRRVPQMVEEARLLASRAQTLQDLQDALSVFNGCSLKETAIHTVFSDGVAGAKIMLVGEAPGADEDRYGKPFIGKSGKLLDQMLAHIGLDRQANLYISNVIPWRPPGNRAPTVAEIDVCRPFIERHIQLIAPEILIFSGGIAAKTLLNKKQGITQLRGKQHAYDLANFSWDPQAVDAQSIPAFAIFHPAFILRQPLQKKAIWKDLLDVRAELDKNNL